jgi:signal transduction histidine kinase
MREQLEHATAELKTEERTRLAVELHDSIAQNLTGVSLEIDTASKIADEDPAAMRLHLDLASRSLKSCRDELRNCLWDLRNRALEADTMDQAILQTLAPHVADIRLVIRFNVPRERISDNTAHAILCIIRELVLNAIRHGDAGEIRIAGSIAGDRMYFSVLDDGCGFDPSSAPGFDQGHYGLLGIQERIDKFEGEFTLKSTPGKGTKATLSLQIPQESGCRAHGSK